MASHKPFIAVFCGSKSGNRPLYEEHAAALGTHLGKEGYNLVYGGSSFGIMGQIANHALAAGAEVVGVLPEGLIPWERHHSSLTEMIIAKDMHERKKTMYEMCEAAIVLPGGFGTLDELFEMLTWNQLKIHNKKIFILNSGGFYDHLIQHLQFLEEQHFLHDPLWSRIVEVKEPTALMTALKKELT